MIVIDAYDEVYAYGRNGSDRYRVSLDDLTAKDIERIHVAVANHESVAFFDVPYEPDLVDKITMEEIDAELAAEV